MLLVYYSWYESKCLLLRSVKTSAKSDKVKNSKSQIKRVNPDCICGPMSKLQFSENPKTLSPSLRPGLFFLPWVLIISQTVGRKTKHQTESLFEDLLSAVTVHCGKISVHFLQKKKKKVHGSVRISGPVPQAWHYPHTALSFGPLPFFRILVSSWMVCGTWMGRSGGG